MKTVRLDREAEARNKAWPSRWRAIRLIQVGFVLLLLGAILWTWQATNAGAISAPPSLGPLTRHSQVTGPEAVAQVSQLHGVKIPLKEAFVGHYSGSQGALTAWVSLSASEAEAEDLLQRMVEGIRTGSSRVFTGLGESHPKGKHIYEVSSQGMSQYFYRSGPRLVWIAVEAGSPRVLLDAALDAL